jgi:tryptophan synthase beta chain
MSGMTPLLPMYTLGHEYIPDTIHAGGLRYHGMSPLVSKAVQDGLIEPRSIGQTECFEAAIKFARSEGIVPAPESSHALAMAMREAVKAKEEGKVKVIVFGLSGHGMLDLYGYDKFLSGNLQDHEPTNEQIARSLDCIKSFPKA